MNADDLVFRIACALKIAHELRAALEANGNYYSGALVPNLTSVTDCFLIDMETLQRCAHEEPRMNPSAEELAQLKQLYGVSS